MTILDEIISHKREEVKRKKERYPLKLLEESIFFETEPVSLAKYITRPDKLGIIAEIKRRSPSRGELNSSVNKREHVEQLSIGYMQAGASALSVLTDERYFGGKNEDLTVARKFNFCPILRKDFTIDQYQIVEARSIGADAILLIAAVLSAEEVKQLAVFAKSLKLEVLLEVHSKDELGSVCEEVDIVGVNNRSLSTFNVDINQSLSLVDAIPQDKVKISESGIGSAATIYQLKQAGYQGFLIGEAFMTTSMPHKACEKLLKELRKLVSGS